MAVNGCQANGRQARYPLRSQHWFRWIPSLRNFKTTTSQMQTVALNSRPDPEPFIRGSIGSDRIEKKFRTYREFLLLLTHKP